MTDARFDSMTFKKGMVVKNVVTNKVHDIVGIDFEFRAFLVKDNDDWWLHCRDAVIVNQLELQE